MLFDSAVFLFVFLPTVFVGYFVLARLSHRTAELWLVLASGFFYAYWNPVFVFLLTASIAANYSFGVLIQRLSRRPTLQSASLVIAIAANLSILVYFKYLFPLLAWLASFGVHIPYSNESVILPLGISFFTFTQIGYLIDCEGGGVKEQSLLDYTLFVTFFPHLIAGPILHHREMMPQFRRREVYRIQSSDVDAGVTLFTIGLAKKRLIADQLAPLVDGVFSQPVGTAMPMAWLGALAYSLQIYFDFSGYSDMAIGIARIFGIRFPLNFNSPYKATCIIDFWQRWLMTLTRYLTSYLYNPIVLFISRQRLVRGMTVSRAATATAGGFSTLVALPLLFTMTIAGVWHGAGLQFLIFGALHGVYLTINHAWRVFRVPTKKNNTWLVKGLELILTYCAVLVAQVFFRATSIPDALQVLMGMFGFHGIQFDSNILNSLSRNDAMAWVGIIVGSFLLVWAMPNSNEIVARYEKLGLPLVFRGVFYATLFFVIALGASGPPVQFLYFQF